ncbi:IS3-Spn1 transposase, truncation [Streptococcus pneumoniae]|uniref:IS3 family transposase n=1 Tax=Streptococcus pneumoniae TaxID=1313 RepID=UPI001024770A|nr:IS3 family transposase [Streptococcus pneumoniae]VFH65211.1 IS3-Spn1 transposase, truncation [Streptococcus pneumoniae]
MKLTYDDKVQIYELRKQGYILEKLSNKFGINNSNLRYMIKLIDRYGIEFVKKGKNRYYSPEKLYLSPVLDGFNSEIIAYNLSTSPNLEQVQTMLEQAFTEKHYENTILHSDQGWQYRHDSYHRFLESKGVQASMSRKGNSQDNGMMESFFGILKSEMFYGYEKSFQSLKQLEQAIVDYIDYYNNKRIKVKLKGLSPVQYRTKSFG